MTSVDTSNNQNRHRVSRGSREDLEVAGRIGRLKHRGPLISSRAITELGANANAADFLVTIQPHSNKISAAFALAHGSVSMRFDIRVFGKL